MTRRRMPRTGWAVIGAAAMFGITGAITAASATGNTPSAVDDTTTTAPTETTLPEGVVQGGLFHSVDPARVLDSRAGGDNIGTDPTPWGEGETRTVQIAGVEVGGTVVVPEDATAVTLNLTVDNTTAWSYLTVWPSGGTQPNASNLNWNGATTGNDTVANQTTVTLGEDGAVQIYNAFGNANVIADVQGYYVDGNFVTADLPDPGDTTTTTTAESTTTTAESTTTTEDTTP